MEGEEKIKKRKNKLKGKGKVTMNSTGSKGEHEVKGKIELVSRSLVTGVWF